MEKCTFCLHRTREGRLPACLEACPTGARVFGNVLDPDSEIRWVLDNKRVFVLKEELGTQAAVLLLLRQVSRRRLHADEIAADESDGVARAIRASCWHVAARGHRRRAGASTPWMTVLTAVALVGANAWAVPGRATAWSAPT